jgi:hypothetical protein
VPAPIVPPLHNAMDTSHFDNFDDAEEELAAAAVAQSKGPAPCQDKQVMRRGRGRRGGGDGGGGVNVSGARAVLSGGAWCGWGLGLGKGVVVGRAACVEVAGRGAQVVIAGVVGRWSRAPRKAGRARGQRCQVQPGCCTHCCRSPVPCCSTSHHVLLLLLLLLSPLLPLSLGARCPCGSCGTGLSRACRPTTSSATSERQRQPPPRPPRHPRCASGWGQAGT